MSPPAVDETPPLTTDPSSATPPTTIEPPLSDSNDVTPAAPDTSPNQGSPAPPFAPSAAGGGWVAITPPTTDAQDKWNQQSKQTTSIPDGNQDEAEENVRQTF